MDKKELKIKAVFDGQINGVRYYNIINAKFIILAKLRGKYEIGDIFNVYTETDRKYGCEWDGESIESSIEKLETALSDLND